MLAPNDPELHQSIRAAGLAGCWQLAAGRALSLRLRTAGVLQITQGQAWVTLNERERGHGEDAGDHFLGPGQRLPVRAGRHLVIESLDQAPVHFEWLPATAPPHGKVAVVRPLADLARAAALAGRALLQLLAGLGAYLVAGLLPFRRR